MVSSEVTIEEVEYCELLPFKGMSSREHVPLNHTHNTKWFGAFSAGTLVGFTAIYTTPNFSRIKSTFVLPFYRNRGIGTLMNDFCFEMLLKNPDVVKISAFVTPINLKWYLKNNFKEISKRNNITSVEYEKL